MEYVLMDVMDINALVRLDGLGRTVISVSDLGPHPQHMLINLMKP